MAVTLSLADVRERIGAATAGEYDIAPLWFNVARAAVVKYAPSAPDESHNLACMMMVDYWDGIPDPPPHHPASGRRRKGYLDQCATVGQFPALLRRNGAVVTLEGAPCYLTKRGAVRR